MFLQSRAKYDGVAAWIVALLTILVVTNATTTPHKEEQLDYGVDVSFPIQRSDIRADYQPIGSHRQESYTKYIKGCQKWHGEKSGELCLKSERKRIETNLYQPPQMKNFTTTGFHKMAVPTSLATLLSNYFHEYSDRARREVWPQGSTSFNYWETDSFLLPLSSHLHRRVSEVAHDAVQEWIQKSGDHREWILTAIPGIRIYKTGSILAPHTSQLPLVTTCIFHVDNVDTAEPWPLELIGHDGKAHNVTLKPGEMLLFESHSIIHGRPFEFRGTLWADLYVHFEPYGYTAEHLSKLEELVDGGKEAEEDLEALYETAWTRHQSTKDDDNFQSFGSTPAYVEKRKEGKWNQDYIYHEDRALDPKEQKKKSKIQLLVTPHAAAARGQLKILKQLKKTDPKALHKADANGWKPLHEAVRAGELEVIQYLVEDGGDINERTNFGKGGTPLWLALQELRKDHPVVKYLEKKGAQKVGPNERSASKTDKGK